MDQPSDLSHSPTDNPVIVRRSELLNLTVMNRDTMEAMGRIEQLWMYPQAHRILGIICKRGGLWGQTRWAYKLPQIDSISKGSLWVTGEGTATDQAQVRQLQSLIDHEIWADGGDRLGLISDCLFNRKTGQITQYLLIDNRLRQWIDDPLPLPPSEILSFGNQRALVRPDTQVRLRRERPNLRESLGQLKQEAKAEYDQATTQASQRLRHWGQEAKTTQERLAEQAEQLSQQAAERAKRLAEQAVNRSQELAQELAQDLTQDLAQDRPQDRVKEQAQGLSQQAGRRYRRLQRRAEDLIEELPLLERLRGTWSGEGDRAPCPLPDEPGTEDFGAHDQVTWVDEAGALPPGQPPGQPQPPTTSSTQTAPDAIASRRDDPWGYGDRATASDWDDLEAAIAPDSILAEDLADDDPWI